MEFAELILTPKVDGVILRGPFQEAFDGTLCITGHHLILSSRKEGVQELWLLHQNIDWIDRRPNIQNNISMGGQIVLKCKDLRLLSLEIQSPQEFLNVAQSLEQLYRVDELRLLYPFFYRPMYSVLEDGYTIYRPESEFSKLLSTDDWRLSHVNRDFGICSTYPSLIVVPKTITDEQIIQSANFRDGGRFPVISYKHENGAVLLRSAQPMSGIKRCRADEAILNVVLDKSTKGFIIDTWGKGKSNTETEQHYSQWRKVTRPIGNLSSISAILDGYVKLIEACNDVQCSSDKWLSRLESSNWMSNILNTLNTACVAAQCLDLEGSPVLIHGGKGLDSALIVASLVQIILNPDCRTYRGIQALIDREWIQAGFPFTTRHKQSCYTPAQARLKSSSATFVLFLDCVYQLHSQFPCSFEFNTNILIILFEHSYSSQYGTFIGDSEKVRTDIYLHKRTTSLWSYLNRPEMIRTLLNPVYDPNPAVIWPSVAPISLVLWSELYLRWVVDQAASKRMVNQIHTLVTLEKELRSKTIRLRRQVQDLQKEFNEISVNARASTENDQ